MELNSYLGRRHDVAYSYDAAGRLDTLHYPATAGGRLAVRYRYHEGELLASVSDVATGQLYWSSRGYNAFAQSVLDVLGNSTVTSERKFDAFGRLVGIRSRTGTTALQDLRYAYDFDSNVVERRNELAQRIESFSYDASDRRSSTTLRNSSFGSVAAPRSHTTTTVVA